MSNPDLEVLKGDIEMLCTMIMDLNVTDGGCCVTPKMVRLVKRIRRNIANPTDASYLHETRAMNIDPRSNRE